MKNEKWIAITNEFFNSMAVKRLRRRENGATNVLIYQKILMLSMPFGQLHYEGIEEDMTAQIALMIDEPVDVVKHVLEIMVELRILTPGRDDGVYVVNISPVLSAMENIKGDYYDEIMGNA